MHKNIRLDHSKWGVLLVLIVLSAMSTSATFAQNAIRINEVHLNNQSGYIDESGNRSPWIEFYNPSAATINMGGMFLSDDPNEPAKFPIRTGSKKSIVPPYQTFVVFLDGEAGKGVHHVDMVLDPSQTNTIYLYLEDGVTLVDQITIPPMDADISYARVPDGKGDFQLTTHVTPDELNDYFHGNENIKNFRTYDPYGLVMTLIAVSTVFIALIILYFVFKGTGNLFTRKEREKEASKSATPIQTSKPTKKQPKSDEVYAAIAMALHDANGSPEHVAIAMALYQSGILGGERSGMIYLSPEKTATNWANKSFMMRRTPKQLQK